MIVIAGAGSGKTRVLTYRIAYLMSQGVDPFNILALTFTNKAAREMKGRIAQIVGDSEAKNLWMGTFHSVFAKILRIEADRLGYPSNFTIYDTQDSDRLIASIIKEMNLDKDVYKYKQIRSRISSYKNSLITVKAYFNNPELIKAQELGLKIYSYPEFLYEQSKGKTRVVIGGSHGKTTITSMILHVMHYYDRDVDFMVGAQLEGFDVMVKLTEENDFIECAGRR